MYNMVNRPKKIMKYIGAIKEGSRALLGKDLSRAVSERAAGAVMPSYAKGGRIRKTGAIRAHAGEVVLNKKVVKALKALMK